MKKNIHRPHVIDEISFTGREGDSYLVCTCDELLAEPTPEILQEAYRLHRKKHGLQSRHMMHATEYTTGIVFEPEPVMQRDYI